MIGEMKRTKSTVYILPMLGHDRTFFDYLGKLMNAYMFEEAYPGIKGCLYLLYSISNDIFEDSEIGKRLIKHKSFVGHYRVFANREYTMVAFELPETYSFDISKFWEGKFSQFTDYFKMEILSFHGAIPNSILHGILGKTTKTKQHLEKTLTGDKKEMQVIKIPNGMDLDSKPVVTNETFFYKALYRFDKDKQEKEEKSCNSIPSDSSETSESTSKLQRRRRATTN